MLFLNLLVSSTFISISAISWFSAWIGLEMNLLAILPLMKMYKNKLSAEASIKYFIIQAMASSSLLFSIIILSNMNLMNTELLKSPSMLINSALILKMGAAPLHFWLPEVISGLNWNMVFVILTWQKIAPMILLSYSLCSPIFLSMIIVISSLASGLSGINQTCLRKIMAFSSINHMSWMICSLFSSLNLWFYYFMIYSTINMNIILMLNKFNMFYFNQLTKLFSYNKTLKFLFMLNILSLGGLPPFIGFLPKWLTINFLINLNFITLSLTITILTLTTLYFYIRMTFSTLTLNYSESLTTSMNFYKLKSWYFYMNLLSLMGLPLSFFLANMI